MATPAPIPAAPVSTTTRSTRVGLAVVLLASAASAALMYAAHTRAGQYPLFQDPRLLVHVAIAVAGIAACVAAAGVVRTRRLVRGLAVFLLLAQALLLVVAGALLLTPRQGGMFRAIYRGDEAGVRAALAWGVGPNDVTHWGWSHAEGETPLTAAATTDDAGIVRLLLVSGADPNRLDGHGVTPIYQATGAGRKDVVRLLLERGADPKRPQRDGDLPLHVAAVMGRVGLIDLFLGLGIDVNTRGRRGGTPLHRAAIGSVEAAERLLRRGADPSLKDDDRHTPADIARNLLLDRQRNIRLYGRGGPVDMKPVERLKRLVELLEPDGDAKLE